jgi:beta-ureidopropionase / N-carbamoyl-L-amino-acid hydrolase
MDRIAYDRKDAKGKRFGDELARIGWVGDEPVGARKMHAMLELHIEQGPILEAEGKDRGCHPRAGAAVAADAR